MGDVHAVTVDGHRYLASADGRTILEPRLLVGARISKPVVMVAHQWAVWAITLTGADVCMAAMDAPMGNVTPEGAAWAAEQQRLVLAALAEARQ